jgi:hypothetical protein
MISGGAYLVASLVISLLIKCTPTGVRRLDADEHMFRYPLGLRVLLMMSGPILLILDILCGPTGNYQGSSVISVGLQAVFVLLAIGAAFVFLYYERFYLVVGVNEFRWRTIARIHHLKFDDVVQIEFRTLEKGQLLIVVTDNNGAALKVSNTLEEFNVLESVLREKLNVGHVKIIDH